MIGGEHAHLGAQKTEDGNIQLPLLLRPAISTATIAAAATVFARFASFLLQSLNQRKNKWWKQN